MKLLRCKNCNSLPKLHKKKNKYYYECNGDCWEQTKKHWTEEEAAQEWNKIQEDKEIIIGGTNSLEIPEKHIIFKKKLKTAIFEFSITIG